LNPVALAHESSVCRLNEENVVYRRRRDHEKRRPGAPTSQRPSGPVRAAKKPIMKDRDVPSKCPMGRSGRWRWRRRRRTKNGPRCPVPEGDQEISPKG